MATAAKPPAKQEHAPAAAEAPPKKRSGKLLLIIVLVVLVLLLAAVLVVGFLVLAKKGGSHAGGDSGHEEARVEANAPAALPPTLVDLTKPPVFAALDPFTVNLRDDNGDGDRYLQAVIALRVTDQKTADALKGFMPEIRHRINMAMSAKAPGEIQTIQGRETLANEILVQINTLLGVPPPPPDSPFHPLTQGPIQAVLFNSFIIQ